MIPKKVTTTTYLVLVLLILVTSNAVSFSIPPNPNRLKKNQIIIMSKGNISDLKSSSKTPTKKMKNDVIRWAIRGIAGELIHNLFLRQIGRVTKYLIASKQQQQSKKAILPIKNESALITGATGGIGSEMARELAFRGYDVIIAARNVKLGKELVLDIQRELEIADSAHNEGAKQMPIISFMEYHADVYQSALDVSSKLADVHRVKPLTVLVNNAGIMGKSEQLSVKVNTIAPIALTLALLNMRNSDKENKNMKIINVSSSSHLRATGVFNNEDLQSSNNSLMDVFPDTPDEDLSTYAKSKLALLQFSTLLRHNLPNNEGIRVFDAHPGLVWTPLLRNHIGDKATNILKKTGLAGLIYKSPIEGSHALLAALDHTTGTNNEQLYFVNGKPGGYASPESRDLNQSQQLLDRLIKPELEGIVRLPDGW